MAKNQLQHASLTYHKFAGIVPSWKFKKFCCCYKCCFVLLYCRKKQRSINIASFRSKHFRNVINLPEKLETKPDIHKSLKPILDLLKNFRKITSKHLYLSPSSVKLQATAQCCENKTPSLVFVYNHCILKKNWL